MGKVTRREEQILLDAFDFEVAEYAPLASVVALLWNQTNEEVANEEIRFSFGNGRGIGPSFFP